jgi:hypothetical protein
LADLEVAGAADIGRPRDGAGISQADHDNMTWCSAMRAVLKS